MPIDRQLWLHGFTWGSMQPWSCPRCGYGTLKSLTHRIEGHDGKVRDLAAIIERESQASMNSRDFGDPDYDCVFAGVLQCSRQDCGEVVAVSGTSHFDPGDEHGITRYYLPKCFEPPLPIFKIPEKCPKVVAVEVNAAFALYWADPSACINCIRCAVERFLDHAKVPRFRIMTNKATGKSRRGIIVLHERIELFKKTQPDIAKRLSAIKWLGNAGSHQRKVTKEDALQGFDILQWVLNKRFDPDDKHVAKLTSEINRRKGPVSNKRKPKK